MAERGVQMNWFLNMEKIIFALGEVNSPVKYALYITKKLLQNVQHWENEERHACGDSQKQQSLLDFGFLIEYEPYN